MACPLQRATRDDARVFADQRTYAPTAATRPAPTSRSASTSRWPGARKAASAGTRAGGTDPRFENGPLAVVCAAAGWAREALPRPERGGGRAGDGPDHPRAVRIPAGPCLTCLSVAHVCGVVWVAELCVGNPPEPGSREPQGRGGGFAQRAAVVAGRDPHTAPSRVTVGDGIAATGAEDDRDPVRA
ncbi:hypothetical protein EF917_20650 [Streptomyces sp. WAC00469]|nr:hypothetical protein EF917_20650 [Streptomyces sp. WAC00469]